MSRETMTAAPQPLPTPGPGPARAAMPRVFLRSFWLQGAWNFERLQNIGFLFALRPALDRVWRDPHERRAAARRHAEYFNTHPLMSGYCLGAVAKMEEHLAAAPKAQRLALEARQHALKAAMASACAAIGDPFFWSTLRPFCAALAVLVWGLGAFAVWAGDALRDEPFSRLPASVFLAGSAAYLLVFNAVGLRARWKGARRGYREGEELAKELKKLPLRLWEGRLRAAGFAATALTALAFAGLAAARGDGWVLLALLAMAALKAWEFSNLAVYGALLAVSVTVALIQP